MMVQSLLSLPVVDIANVLPFVRTSFILISDVVFEGEIYLGSATIKDIVNFSSGMTNG